MKRKVIAALLAATMVFGTVGCGGKTQEQAPASTGGSTANESSAAENNETPSEAGSEAAEGETGTAEAGEDGYTVYLDPATGEPFDLGGMEVIIADWWSSDEEGEEEDLSAYDEAHDAYIDWMQETYNFTIKSKAVTSWADVPENFVNYATSGGDENYIFVLYPGSATMSAMSSGLMYDLAKLDVLDFSDDKWLDVVTDVMSEGDAVYGMRADIHEPSAGMFFNKRLLEEAGINPDDLYELQRNNEWTWDKFEEICKEVQKDTDNDGVIDRYAMANFTSRFYPAAVFSNGGQFIGRDENGVYYNDLESDATMEALNWALDMLNKYEMVYPADAEWDYCFTAFKNGEAVFEVGEVYQAGQDFGEMEDDFGFLCFPMGPRVDGYRNYSSDNIYVIPSCYDDEKARNLAIAYNLYTSPVPGYEDYESWQFDYDYYSSFRDTEAVEETLPLMVESGMPQYQMAVTGIDMGPDLYWTINKDNTPAQAAEAIRNTWQSYLDERNGLNQ